MKYTEESQKRLKDLLSTKWKTKDGNVIFIKDMDDGHLNNAIHYMVRNGKGNSEGTKALQAEKERRIKAGIMVRSSQCREDTLIFGDD